MNKLNRQACIPILSITFLYLFNSYWKNIQSSKQSFFEYMIIEYLNDFIAIFIIIKRIKISLETQEKSLRGLTL